MGFRSQKKYSYKRGSTVIADGSRKPTRLRDVVFNERKAAEIAQLAETYDNWNKHSDQVHSQCSDVDESETEAMDTSQPKLSYERDKCNDKR